MLTKLVDASGTQIVIELVGPGIHSLGDHLAANRAALVAALEGLGASNIRVFGSVARGEETATSDFDLLVDLDDSVGVLELAAMCGEAERILGRPVDVVPASSLKHDIAERVLAEARAL